MDCYQKRFAIFVLINFTAIIEICTSVSLGDVHTSVANIDQLVKTENQIAEILTKFVDAQQSRLDLLKKYLDDWRSTRGEDLSGNPLNSYHFLQRLSDHLPPVIKAISDKIDQTAHESVSELLSSTHLPSGEDVNGAAWSLIRLQDTYNLSMADLIEGTILGHSAFRGLSIDDCIRFGMQSFKNLEFDLSDAWTVKSIELINAKLPLDEVSQEKIEHLEDIRNKRKMMQGLVTKMATHAADDITDQFSGLGVPASFQRQIYNDEKDTAQIDKIEENYKKLCMGTLKQEKDFLDAPCIYLRGKSPYRILMPFKAELIFSDPIIIVFHDVLQEEEMELMKEAAYPRLQTTAVHSYTNHRITKSLARVGKTAWLKKYDGPFVNKILQRVQDMTGFTTESAEDMHVLNYGVAGHYDIHVDFFDLKVKNMDTEPHQGDRLATVLFYLNKVESGGDTVFPNIGIGVPPEKGSALVWVNLQRNGLGDYRTMHAACPVLLGQKWIANLWLHEYGQEFVWPCTLDPDL